MAALNERLLKEVEVEVEFEALEQVKIDVSDIPAVE